MWQVLLAAAAAAGSGILAKKLITPIDSEKPISDCEQNDLECDQDKSSPPKDSIFELDGALQENSSQEKRETPSIDGRIFRFSSPESGSKEFRKNSRNGFRGFKKNGGSKTLKKNGAAEGGRKEVVGNQIGSVSGKRVPICLKKRRTGKHAAGKCEFYASKDSSFGWGVGLGIMYVMSAGNAEITKLNSAMVETVKTVQELKAEIARRKSSCDVNVSIVENEAETNKKLVERSYNGPLFTQLGPKGKDNNRKICPALNVDGECASSIHMVEQQPEVLEMHRLEVELESELQKLPWVSTEGSGSEGRSDIFKAEDLAKEQPSENFEKSNSHQYNGVLAAELDQKLCHLLIGQQESQIVELEAELHQAHSKLHQKEAELQALKDCVKRLTEFSLVNASDDQTEDQDEDVKTVREGIDEKLGFESMKSMVGMKRSLGYESYICSKN